MGYSHCFRVVGKKKKKNVGRGIHWKYQNNNPYTTGFDVFTISRIVASTMVRIEILTTKRVSLPRKTRDV